MHPVQVVLQGFSQGIAAAMVIGHVKSVGDNGSDIVGTHQHRAGNRLAVHQDAAIQVESFHGVPVVAVVDHKEGNRIVFPGEQAYAVGLEIALRFIIAF